MPDSPVNPTGAPGSARVSGARFGWSKSQADWLAEGRRLFGLDFEQWRFQCPMCEHVQTPADFAAVDVDPQAAYQEYIGRHVKPADGVKSPCTYAAYGLFKSGCTVIADGRGFSVFPFASEEAMDNPTTIRVPHVKAARRIAEAYLKMAHVAKYRPEAPGDGCGGISLTQEQLASRDLLEREAVAYAGRFIREEDTRTFFIGVSNLDSNRAFVYTIEAARLMAGADEKRAAVLLSLALTELLGGVHG